LKIIAFNADFVACSLVFQKLIRRKEQTPIPSHPRKSTIKLSADTNKYMKNVNKESKEKNLTTLKSPSIYPIEKK